MSERLGQSRRQEFGSSISFLRRYWWVLALVVLAILVGVIYLLSHLSAADSEMYPTTMLRAQQVLVQLC